MGGILGSCKKGFSLRVVIAEEMRGEKLEKRNKITGLLLVVQVNRIATAGQGVRSQGRCAVRGESFADKLQAKKRISAEAKYRAENGCV